MGNAPCSEASQPNVSRWKETHFFGWLMGSSETKICKIKSCRLEKSKEAAVQFTIDTSVLHVATRFMAEATSSTGGKPGPLLPRCRIGGQVLVDHIACRRLMVTRDCRPNSVASASGQKFSQTNDAGATIFQWHAHTGLIAFFYYIALFSSLSWASVLTHVEKTSQETKMVNRNEVASNRNHELCQLHSIVRND